MVDVSVRDLRNHGGEVLDRVAAGERVIVTRGGHPVAELSAVGRAPIGIEVLLDRWRHLPRIDAGTLRRDLEAVLDSRL